MVGTSGGTIVPPRDGDRFSSDGDEGLVAQIIPLRHREREPYAQQTPRTAAGDEALEDTLPSAGEPLSQGERSIWDPPTVELRRRGTQRGPTLSLAAPSPAAGAVAFRLSWRVLALPAMTAIAAAVLALILAGALRGPAGSAVRGRALATATASSAATGGGLVANRSSSARASSAARAIRRKHSQQPPRGRRRNARRRQSSPPRRTRELAVADSGAGAPTSAIGRPTAASSTTESSSATRPGESASAEAQGALAPGASAPSTARSQCVPGELGC